MRNTPLRAAAQDSADVRRAIAQTIDAETLVEAVFDGTGAEVDTSLFGDSFSSSDDEHIEFDLDAATSAVEEISDLRPDMILEGVVTNVAAFGAFVDIGVHQDGLVHISALSNTFVKDPHTVVKAGQVVKVKVLEVDPKRKRIALTMRLADSAPQPGAQPQQRADRNDRQRVAQHGRQERPADKDAAGAMAAAFAKLRK